MPQPGLLSDRVLIALGLFAALVAASFLTQYWS